MRNRSRHLALLFWVALSSLVYLPFASAINGRQFLKSQKSGCAAFLIQHAEITTVDETVLGKMTKTFELLVTGRNGFSDEEVDVFLNSGWPALQKYAVDHEKSVESIFSGTFEQMKFVNEMMSVDQAQLRGMLRGFEGFLNLVRWLDGTTKSARKVKPSDRQYLRRMVFLLYGIAFWNTSIEVDVKGSSNLNPFLPLDEVQIIKILNQIDMITEDAVLEYALKYERDREEARKNKARQEEVRQTLEQQRDSQNVLQSDLHVELQSELRAEPEVTQSAAFTASESGSNSININGQSPAISIENPAKGSQSVATSIDQEKPLIEVIEPNGTLTPGQIYYFTNFKGERFTIEFSNEVSKVAASGDRDNIRKLLASVYVGKGDSSGVKLLPETIRHLMEIKASVHGHKRLIGCIDGRHLKIKKFYNIHATRAAYARLIPQNLCD